MTAMFNAICVYIIFLFRYDMIMGVCSLNHPKLFFMELAIVIFHINIYRTTWPQYDLGFLVSLNFVSVVFQLAVVQSLLGSFLGLLTDCFQCS